MPPFSFHSVHLQEPALHPVCCSPPVTAFPALIKRDILQSKTSTFSIVLYSAPVSTTLHSVAGQGTKRKMSSFQPDSDDDDDDMFIMRGGTLGSIYSAEPIVINDDDDDDDDDVVEVLAQQKKKKRGRRTKLNDHLRPKSHDIISIDDDCEDNVSSVKPSVFTNIDNNMPINLDDDPVVSVADDNQFRAQQAIANARALLGSKGDEAKIERDAELYAKRAAEEKARKDALMKTMDNMSKALYKAPNHHDVIPSTNAVANASVQGEKGAPITLKVREGANSINMKIFTTDPLRKMLQPFCKRFNIDFSKAVMEVDGEEIEEEDTAATYDLEDKCIIDVRVRK